MSDEQQPRAEWIFPEEKKSNKGRIWLIVGLSILAVAIVAALLFFLLPRPGASEPTLSPSTTTSPPPARTPTATPTPTEPAPSEPPAVQPPVPDPDIASFAAQVQPRLDDAATGLTFLAESSGQDALQIVSELQGDAARLSDAAAPNAIASSWYSAVGDYAARLGDLRSAIEGGSDAAAATAATTAALQELRALVGI